SCRREGSTGVPQRRRQQLGRGRDLGSLVRERRQGQDLLHLRRTEPGGDPQDREQELAAGGQDHAGQRSRPVLLPLNQIERRREKNMRRWLTRIWAAMAAVTAVLGILVLPGAAAGQ